MVSELKPWSAYPHLDLDELLNRFPAMAQRADKEDADDDDNERRIRHWCTDHRFIVLSGEVGLNQARLDDLTEDTWIVVDGNAFVEGWVRSVFYVTGDLFCNAIFLTTQYPCQYVDGRIVASDCAELMADDDTTMRAAPQVRLETPYVFAYFTDLANIDLAPDAVIFTLGEDGFCTNLPNPVFYWHGAIHVLDARFFRQVAADESDEVPWYVNEVARALQRGEVIYKDGFDIACHALQQAAQRESGRRAYTLYRQAASVSPGYYPAWYGMAETLFRAGALAQALEMFRRAALVFPAEQWGLINHALNKAALCAIRCRQLGLADELATASIMHNAERTLWPEALATPHRLDAEIRLLSGDDVNALVAIDRALAYDPHYRIAHWLRGLILFRQGELDAAADAYSRSSSGSGTRMPLYANQDNSDFLTGALNTVDWEGALFDDEQG